MKTRIRCDNCRKVLLPESIEEQFHLKADNKQNWQVTVRGIATFKTKCNHCKTFKVVKVVTTT